jgi:hypothetical protein
MDFHGKMSMRSSDLISKSRCLDYSSSGEEFAQTDHRCSAIRQVFVSHTYCRSKVCMRAWISADPSFCVQSIAPVYDAP